MDIVVKGRNVEVPDHYRVHVEEKLTRLERYDRKVIRFDVELFHEPNRRQSKNCQRVEITGKGRGPAVRAEACAGDFYAALDAAVTKLENRLRRLHDRRRVHYGRRGRTSVAEATAPAADLPRCPPTGAPRPRCCQREQSRNSPSAIPRCRHRAGTAPRTTTSQDASSGRRNTRRRP
jgi:ribosomal subunit interface protein